MAIILLIATAGQFTLLLSREIQPSGAPRCCSLFASGLQCIFFNTSLITLLNYKVQFRQFTVLESKGS